MYLIEARYLFIYGIFGGDSLWRATRIAEVIQNKNLLFIYKDGYTLYLFYSVLMEIIGINSFQVIGYIAVFISLLPYLFIYLLITDILDQRENNLSIALILFSIFYFLKSTIILTQTSLSLLFMYAIIYYVQKKKLDLAKFMILFLFSIGLIINQMIFCVFILIGLFILNQFIIIFYDIKRSLFYIIILTFFFFAFFIYWNVIINSFEIIEFVFKVIPFYTSDLNYALIIISTILILLYSVSFGLRYVYKRYKTHIIKNKTLRNGYYFFKKHSKILIISILIFFIILYLLSGYFAPIIGSIINLSNVRAFNELILTYLPHFFIILVGVIGFIDLFLKNISKLIKDFLVIISFLGCFIIIFIFVILLSISFYYSPLEIIPFIILFLSVFGFNFLLKNKSNRTIYKKIISFFLIGFFCILLVSNLAEISKMRQSFPPLNHEISASFWLKTYSNKCSYIATDYRYTGIIIYSGINTFQDQYIGWQLFQFANYEVLFKADNMSDDFIHILIKFCPSPTTSHYGIDYIFLGNSMINYECYCYDSILSKISQNTINIYQSRYFNKIYDDFYNYIFSNNLI